MQKFIEELLKEIGTVDLTEAVGPDRKVGQGDKVVGVMSDDLKRFCVVYRQACDDKDVQCAKVHEQLGAIAGKPFSEITAEEWTIVQDHYMLHGQTKAIQDLFWLAVKMEFKELFITQRGIGLRKDWTVVTYPVEQSTQVRVGPPILIRGSDLGAFLASLDGESLGISGGLEDMFSELIGAGGSRRRR